MAHEPSHRSYYANQLLRLYHAEEQVAGFVDKLLDKVNHPELKQVIEEEKLLLDQERLAVKRIYDRLDVKGEPKRAEAFLQAVREAERTVDDLDDLGPDLRDLEIIAVLHQLKAQEKSTIRALLTYANEMDLDGDVREFQSMLRRENASDERLTHVARNHLHGADSVGRTRPRQ